MILYHFTSITFLFPRGVPGEVQASDLTLEPRVAASNMPQVVWLTTDPNPGGPDKESTNGGNYCYVWIKLLLPSADRNLAPLAQMADEAFWS
jgi:hypothetical protein